MLAPVSRTEVCGVCGADVRVCKNCVYYAPGAQYDCRETVDGLVADKERSNFCEAFSLNPSAGIKTNAPGKSAFDKAKKARSAFDALFS